MAFAEEVSTITFPGLGVFPLPSNVLVTTAQVDPDFSTYVLTVNDAGVNRSCYFSVLQISNAAATQKKHSEYTQLLTQIMNSMLDIPQEQLAQVFPSDIKFTFKPLTQISVGNRSVYIVKSIASTPDKVISKYGYLFTQNKDMYEILIFAEDEHPGYWQSMVEQLIESLPESITPTLNVYKDLENKYSVTLPYDWDTDGISGPLCWAESPNGSSKLMFLNSTYYLRSRESAIKDARDSIKPSTPRSSVVTYIDSGETTIATEQAFWYLETFERDGDVRYRYKYSIFPLNRKFIIEASGKYSDFESDKVMIQQIIDSFRILP